ncbi:RNA-binding protein Nop12 [Schizosaccharomyces japonicus yFS275]|uniref:Nucleolar protein 12 n=1 Tax=Schizosaccharomyces japonicus (strain yFS275 / FY16936) TaxID=402676 RepID=B6JVV0_SCHJY|nr:RNA-binding protein Nop12 [Schizosaccharomyces japonicus yFS275]EEB05501.1 RNA-binding protein Nop12 [Schizosaccharomyces japonicus yFS275]
MDKKTSAESPANQASEIPAALPFLAVEPQKVDSSLDDLFKNAAPVQRPPKRDITVLEQPEPKNNDEETAASAVDEDVAMDGEQNGENDEKESKASVELSQNQQRKKAKKQKKQKDESLEANYLEKLAEEEEEEQKTQEKKDEKEDKKEAEKEEEIPEEEKPLVEIENRVNKELEKSERTVFVNNLPAKIVTDKKLTKSLKKHFSQYGKVQSVRFRSIAFSEVIPRKAAFIEKKFHDERDSVNAYVVFETSKAAREAVKLNGTMFLNRHLRVDHISHPAPQVNKRCVFVGNLAFEAEEEPLWCYFEPCGPVEYVRIIRDPKTNLGKGFAYVQFQSAESVDKALLLNGKKMPEGRTLRVSRCKVAKQNKFKGKGKRKGDQHDRTLEGRSRNLIGKSGQAIIKQGIAMALEGYRAKAGDNPIMKKHRKKKPVSKTKKGKH